MNARGEHESSDAGSDKSGGSKRSKLTANKEHERPVSKLRPKVPITLSASNTIYEVATKMTSGRVDAALLLDQAGVLAGIITDNDITRRVISQFVDANEVKVDAVMTKDPKCVHADDPALDALEMMVDNKFRHLPVLDKEGAVVGLLDIAKCLYDAISILEKVQEKDSNKSIDSGNALAEVMTAAMKNMGGSRGNNAAQLLAMKALMENMFGGSVPTLRDIIGDAGYPSVRRTVNVREAAVLMTKHRKGLLVEDNDGEVCGIITPKDIMNRVLSQNKSPDLTAVATVMTPNPDFVTPDYTILEALKEMHDQKYLHLPVRESNGVVVGLVDVMELITHSAGDGKNGKGWRDFFKGAMAARASNNDGKDSDVLSSHSHHSDIDYKAAPAPIRTRYQQQQQQLHAQDSSSDVFSIPNENMKIPSHSASQDYTHHSHLPHIPIPTGATSSHEEISFKITDENKNIHKIKLIPNSNTIELLKEIISEKVSIPKDLLIIKYIDEENDEILLNSNKLLDEAIQLAKKLKLNSVRLIVQEQHNQIKSIRSTSSAPLPTNVMAAAPVIPSVPSSPMKSIREENANNYQQNDENVVNALPAMEESSGELKPAKTLQEMIDPNSPPDSNNKNEEAPANPNPNPSGGGGWLLYGGSAIAAGMALAAVVLNKK
jgi:CBS domain-containing protein